MRVRIVPALVDWMRGKVATWQRRRITPADVRIAYVTAVVIDAAQLLLGPFGWAGFDEMLDVVGVIAISRLLGFHPLLLPSFVLEFVPFTDMLPTWTGCVALVVRSRRRDGLVSADGAPAIDIKATKIE